MSLSTEQKYAGIENRFVAAERGGGGIGMDDVKYLQEMILRVQRVMNSTFQRV